MNTDLEPAGKTRRTSDSPAGRLKRGPEGRETSAAQALVPPGHWRRPSLESTRRESNESGIHRQAVRDHSHDPQAGRARPLEARKNPRNDIRYARDPGDGETSPDR